MLVGRRVVYWGEPNEVKTLANRRLLAACGGDEREAAGIARMLAGDVEGVDELDRLVVVPDRPYPGLDAELAAARLDRIVRLPVPSCDVYAAGGRAPLTRPRTSSRSRRARKVAG